MDPTLASLRENYTQAGLRRNLLADSPVEQFHHWFQQAREAGLREPNAMSLATLDPEGHPAVRIVLLKHYDETGFRFFTNYQSRKGRDIDHCPEAALLFFWNELERQVHIRGRVTKVSREDSEAYFQQRPYGSQIGAWVSRQSDPVPDRAWLERREEELRAEYPEGTVPLPPDWGGYSLEPRSLEFWQGRPNRLHDRFLYQRKGEREWEVERLSP